MKLAIYIFTWWLQVPEVTNGWLLFAQVKFEPKYFKSEDTHFLVPKFTQEIKRKEGTVLELHGYYIPFDMPANALIISRGPYASCFFCGGAGPESIAEVTFESKIPKLKLDQRIRVRGKLKLNENDVNHMCFQLVDAEFIE